MRTRFSLSLADLSAAFAAGLAHAERRGWPVTIAVVDDAGHPIQLCRMDEASPASVDTALGKARSAALTGLDTRVLEEMAGKRPALFTIGRVAVEGGLPLLHRNQRVGGVGVSGVQSHQDREVAEAVVAEFSRQGTV